MTFQIAYSQNLSDYKWKNRILILSDININSTNSNSAYKLLDKEIEAWIEREVIFLFLNN
ncbi:hypothetical protein NYZ99_14015 [Maribacter litopenaei]|uniref:Uncharacterized protein n=1 Tax=Maribacter litopenaei TaxID=2976127 RepID=A0ABY5Y623_9FLAO|nr:hypothetical protein [Maribacter litopenaei]UWX54129.1 hypothetical protein NYZ99_14015 [Maribacter litopenaei]